MPKNEATCEACGKVFPAKPSLVAQGISRACSRTCAAILRTKTDVPNRICEECGAPFYAKESRIAKGRALYCSHQCRAAASSTAIERACEFCKVTFRARQSALALKKGRFCSPRCSSLARNTSRSHICDTCRAEFQSKAHRAPKFCSRDCRVKWPATRVSAPVELNGALTRYVEIGKGRWAIIDDADAALISANSWYFRDGYARGKTRDRGQIAMHRYIMGTPAGLETDHINRNGLDNRRSNLRIVTSAENHQNVGARRDSASGIRNVGWHKQTGKYRVELRVGGKRIYLGLYATLDEAATVARDARAKFMTHAPESA